MTKDLFIMRCRENPELRRSFEGWLADMRETLRNELEVVKGDAIADRQGGLSMLRRLQTRLQKEIGMVDNGPNVMPNK